MNGEKMIGIVGGVGSYAGIDLIKKIYDNTGATTDQEHLPVLMLSLPHKILDRTRFLLNEVNENPADSIAEIISTLFWNGAEVIGIPCNTAHAPKIFDKIRISVPRGCRVLHMIEEVARYIKVNYDGIKRIGVLSTNGTFLSNIYPEILSRYGFEVILPSPETQKRIVHPAIYDREYGIKSFSNPVTERAKKDLMTAVSYLSGEGVEAVILGCTEIPLALNQENIEGCVIIDSTAVLAKALIREYKMLRTIL